MEAVKKWQISKIYAISNALGYVDRNDKENDIMHMIIYQKTGKDSTKMLTYSQANEIIKYLEKQQGKATTPDTMSTGQQKKVWSLMYELKELDAKPNDTPIGERLAGIIVRQFKVKATPKRMFTNLSREDGNQLIEIIKHYISTAERKCLN